LGVLEPRTWDLTGTVTANAAVSAGLLRLDLALPRPVAFAPGQFAMLNLTGTGQLVFRRPFSILAGADRELSFLYRVVGRGTALMAAARPGDRMDCLAPLGNTFPAPGPDTPPVVVLAGGVGLPPLHAWWARHGRPGDLVCFGGRDGADVPWDLLPPPWRVSVDHARDVPAGRDAFPGLVTELAAAELANRDDPAGRLVLACGPTPLLRAAAELARTHRWRCLVSLEEHMGCGYGVCKGCVVPVRSEAAPGWRNATSCTEGPVFDAADLDWARFGAHQLPGGLA
jgi:dihydroorotate dehydrogenase electron transfer subunit